jgi:high-affinity iron transporter
MGQAFLASYLIGLREGLEATLVVSILVAYLVKSGRRRQLLPLWTGVTGAVLLSVFFGGLLTYTETSLLAGYRSRELFEAVTSVLAVVLVTWMIFWMRRTARRLLPGRCGSGPLPELGDLSACRCMTAAPRSSRRSCSPP